MSSFVTNLNSLTIQEIVNWVKTADGCVHTATLHCIRNSTSLLADLFRLVETDCRVGVGGVYWALAISSQTCSRLTLL